MPRAKDSDWVPMMVIVPDQMCVCVLFSVCLYSATKHVTTPTIIMSVYKGKGQHCIKCNDSYDPQLSENRDQGGSVLAYYSQQPLYD